MIGRRGLLALLAWAALARRGWAAGISSEGGIGGTGAFADGGGIGGTGIVGTVTAFGSIWVNGIEVDLPQDARVDIEGRPAGLDAIALGHMVAVEAGWDAARGVPVARSVSVRHAVAGPIDSLDPLTVLGRRVVAEGAAVATALRVGTWVAVSGLARPDGAIVAGRVESHDPALGWMARGVAGADGLSGLAIDLPAGTEAGTRLRAEGTLAPLRATAVTADPENPFGARVARLSLETVSASGDRVVRDGVVRDGAFAAERDLPAPGLGSQGIPAGPPPHERLGSPMGPQEPGQQPSGHPGPGPGPAGPGPGPGPGRGPGGPHGPGRGGPGRGGPGRGGPGRGGSGRH